MPVLRSPVTIPFGVLQGPIKVAMRVSTDISQFKMGLDPGLNYQGPYEVTPKVHDQTLPTKGLYALNDVLVHGIPFRTEQNEYGGTTVRIGDGAE